MTLKQIVIRTDASMVMGHGHVMRCVTLAEGLRARGARVSFICREHEGHLCEFIEQRKFEVKRLSRTTSRPSAQDGPIHAEWLGATWQEDLTQTQAAITQLAVRPEWLIVDHYAIDNRWESGIRSIVRRLMVIDDLADREHDCDVLLDQNLVERMDTRYEGKVPARACTLLGPDYSLLQPVYAEWHARAQARRGPIRRLFVYFGGADNDNLTGRSLDAVIRLGRPDIEVDVVIAAGALHGETIRAQVADYRNIHLHHQVPTLASLMMSADLAIGAGGTTSWERLCLGLPAIVITLAANQRPVADCLSRRNLIRWLGDKEDVDSASIFRALSEVTGSDVDAQWSKACLASVDGLGVNRVLDVLAVDDSEVLRGRHAIQDDEALLLRWANDSVTRRNGFCPDAIPAAAHHEWFKKKLATHDRCRLYIIETAGGIQLGQVRFEHHDGAWEVHYAVAPPFRGRGIGRRLLAEGLRLLQAEMGCVSVFGKVKRENRASQRIFEALAFEVCPGESENVMMFRKRLSLTQDSQEIHNALCK